MQAHSPQVNLLDLPGAWLQQLPEALDPGARLSVFQTCRAFRDLVLSQRRLRLQLTQDILQQQPAQAQASLTFACNHAPDVKLTLVNSNWLERADASGRARSLLCETREAAGAALTAIKSVELQRVVLDALVPTWLKSTCPSVNSLAVNSCQLAAPGTCSSIPICGQLEHLHLGNPPEQFAQWQQQLLGLTGLRSLSVHKRDDLRSVLECCSVLGSQLTQLEVHSLRTSTVNFAAWFPCITQLHMVDFSVTDGNMEPLLRMSSVRSFHCSDFRLQHSHTHRPCSWTELGVHHLDLGAFSRLPLDGLQTWRIIGSSAMISVGDVGEMDRVLTAISKCRGLKWGRVGQEVTEVSVGCSLGWGAPALPSDVLDRFLVILAGRTATQVSLHGLQLTPEVLDSIARHLSVPAVTTIKLVACKMGLDLWGPLLLRLPPQLDEIQVYLHECLPAYLPSGCDSDECGYVPDDSDDYWDHAYGIDEKYEQYINYMEYGVCGLRPIFVEVIDGRGRQVSDWEQCTEVWRALPKVYMEPLIITELTMTARSVRKT